jgi:hypothetical protein
VQLLKDYAASGRRLIVIGDLAVFDEEKTPRAAEVAATLADAGASVLPALDFEAYLADPSGPEAAAVRDQLASLLPEVQVTVSSPSVAAHLSRKGDVIHCHLVNRDRTTSGFRRQTGIGVSIALPDDAGASATHATYVSPELQDGAPTQLPLTRRGHVVQLTVPELEVYGVIVIR